MKPLKTYHMKLIRHDLTDRLWFGTTKYFMDDNHRGLCVNTLREYFDIPEDTKEIWLRVFSKSTKNTYKVVRSSIINNDTVVAINDKYLEEIDCDLIRDFQHLDAVYVEIQYEILC